ncbi:hypothetical protein [Piscinibacter sakaiensis]|uniref:hypothetical protein n=1 Tax=Piscinibacter sakaiensis TaxID=1547922 RepID=UPI003AABEF98
MAEGKDSVLQILEWIWRGVQIFAVLVAGVWTYQTFVWTEGPLLAQNVRLNSHLRAATPATGGCQRAFQVNLENTGKSELNVVKVVTVAYRFELQREPDKFARLIDIDWIRANGTAEWTKVFPDPKYQPDPENKDEDKAKKAKWSPFLGPLRTTETYNHSFDMLLRYEPEAWIYVETEVYVEGSNQPKVGGAWDRVCGQWRPPVDPTDRLSVEIGAGAGMPAFVPASFSADWSG